MLTIYSTILPSLKIICKEGEEGVVKQAIYKNKIIGNVTCPHVERMCDNYYCPNYCSS